LPQPPGTSRKQKLNQKNTRASTPIQHQELENSDINSEDYDNSQIIIEEVTDSGNSTEYDYTKIMDSNIIPHQPKPPKLPPWSRAQIREVREGLLKQKANHVIFLYQDGTPFENGAKQYQETNLLPNYEELTFERARIRTVVTNTLIALPIKLNNHILIEAQNLKNCLKYLVDVITELNLSSFSLSKTDRFDDLPWSYTGCPRPPVHPFSFKNSILEKNVFDKSCMVSRGP